MGADIGKFLPVPTPISKPYWDACKEKQLLLQQCLSCEHVQFYPRSFCTECTGRDLSWVQATGQGVVKSYTIVRHPVSRAYAAETPYVIALIHLDEGPVMMSQVNGCEPEDVSIGMRVKLVFESWSEEFTLPLFEALEGKSDRV
jgi:uncharacterized OB-fold protein